jgi:tetratricopeptide (TPR) repeat protein
MPEPDKHQNANLSVATLSASLDRSLKHGHYDLSLLASAERLNAILNASTDGDSNLTNREHLKMRSMISEYLDYFGRFGEAKKVLADGPKVLEKIRRRKKASAHLKNLDALKLAREEIRFCLEYAQTFYRSHDYAAAKKIIVDCLNAVTKHIADEKIFPCHGTRARIMYYLGRVHRQMNDYDRAESCFIEAIHYHHQRATRKLKLHSPKSDSRNTNAETIREELDFARNKSAICLALGLGWVSYTRGALMRAKSYIMPARVLLLTTKDVINSAYLQLIQGAIERSLAGRDPEKLSKATELLRQSCETFERVGHKAYLARAAFELSLAYLYAGDTAAADRERTKVGDISSQRKDVRWCCNSWILESRIRRAEGKLPAAELLASKASAQAEKSKQFLCKIDALIARAEARMMMERFTIARNDLQHALKMNSARYPNTQGRSAETTNEKIEAVCHLLLARTHISQNDSRQATRHLERWHELREHVEHVSVRELAEEVEKSFKSLRTPFVIPPSPPSINYKKHRDSLVEWLRREAQHQAPSKREQDKLLGWSREARRKRAGKRATKTRSNL